MSSVFVRWRKAYDDPSSVSINELKNILKGIKESGINVNGSFARNTEKMIGRKEVNSWSPKKKNAGRTIKRLVTKHYTRGKYSNYTRSAYRNIRLGRLPTHFSAIKRRMHMFPVTVNVPLYRGIIAGYNGNSTFTPSKDQVLKRGMFISNSFASFSKNRSVAQHFTVTDNEILPFYILRLEPGVYPAINREKFLGSKTEEEVTLAPGKYIVNRNHPLTNNGNIRVTYKPLAKAR